MMSHRFEYPLSHPGTKALLDLTLAVIAINSWNRLAIGARTETDRYQRRSAE